MRYDKERMKKYVRQYNAWFDRTTTPEPREIAVTRLGDPITFEETKPPSFLEANSPRFYRRIPRCLRDEPKITTTPKVRIGIRLYKAKYVDYYPFIERADYTKEPIDIVISQI